MDRLWHDAQTAAHKHHDRARRARQMGEKFGMAGESKTRRDEGRLVNWRCHKGGSLARHRSSHTLLDGIQDRWRISIIEKSWLRRFGGRRFDHRMIRQCAVAAECAWITHEPQGMPADSFSQRAIG